MFPFHGLVVQLVRTPPCHGGGRGFESHPGRHYADLAHLVERHLAKVEVAGSSPVIRFIAVWKYPYREKNPERQRSGFFVLYGKQNMTSVRTESRARDTGVVL